MYYNASNWNSQRFVCTTFFLSLAHVSIGMRFNTKFKSNFVGSRPFRTCSTSYHTFANSWPNTIFARSHFYFHSFFYMTSTQFSCTCQMSIVSLYALQMWRLLLCQHIFVWCDCFFASKSRARTLALTYWFIHSLKHIWRRTQAISKCWRSQLQLHQFYFFALENSMH